jgi:hypothetical protein
MSSNPTDPRGASQCGAVPTERNRYFTGKHMTARDFTGEQEYFLGRHRLHNRLLHGWGILCGLAVEEHPNAACRDTFVVVKAGVVLDCCGREVFLAEDQAVKVERLNDLAGGGVLLCLRYGEELIEPVPVLYSAGGCDASRSEANRVRETASLEFLRLEDAQPGCWLAPGGAGATDPCQGGGAASSAGGCLQADCPCGGGVPLALLKSGGAGQPIAIERRGRRQLPTPAHYLTHVVSINWEHGRELSLDQLRHQPGHPHHHHHHTGALLKIDFDRKLQPTDGLRTGINFATFRVRTGGDTGALEILPTPVGLEPYLDETGRTAVYPIAHEYLDGRESIVGKYVYVSLLCDFLLDCHGVPVCGRHAGGVLPTSGNAPGGTFHSWFRVAQC